MSHRPVRRALASPRHRSSPRRVSHALACAAEALEPRRLLAAVSWDGGGDGTSWNDPLNWSANTLPMTNDDVTINVVANPTITLTGSVTIRSLNNAETLVITGANATQFGSLSLSADSTNNGTIRLSSNSSNGFGALINLDADSTFSNLGTLQATADPSNPNSTRLIQINSGTNTFANSGSIIVDPLVGLTVQGSDPTAADADTFNQQAGVMTVGAGGALTLQGLKVHYTGGSNSDGVILRNVAIDLDAASAASNLTLLGFSNTLIGHDAANLTLKLHGSNVSQFGTLTLNGDIATTGTFQLESDSHQRLRRDRIGRKRNVDQLWPDPQHVRPEQCHFGSAHRHVCEQCGHVRQSGADRHRRQRHDHHPRIGPRQRHVPAGRRLDHHRRRRGKCASRACS